MYFCFFDVVLQLLFKFSDVGVVFIGLFGGVEGADLRILEVDQFSMAKFFPSSFVELDDDEEQYGEDGEESVN